MRPLRLAVVVTLLLTHVVLIAQRPLSLGSIAPANSLWDRALKRMATELQRETGSRVRIRVSSGTQGDEAAIIRRLKLGTTQAAALTQPALGELHDSFNVLGMPFFFESDPEVRHVLEALRPTFTRALAAQELVLINWWHGGWARLFSAETIRTVAELKSSKLFTSAGDDQMVKWYRENGFDPVPLEISDVPVGLNTGLINAYPFPPYAAMLLQYYRSAPHMLDLALGPVVGATVMNTDSWERLSPGDRETILSVARRVEDDLFREVPRQDGDAVEEMKKRGLQITKLNQSELREFRRTADEMNTSMRVSIVPAAVYDEAVRARDAFRHR